MLFDTHVHLDRLPAKMDPVSEAAQARREGIGHFLVPGVLPRDWPTLLAVVESIPGALAAPGVHPLASADWNPGSAAELEELLSPRVCRSSGRNRSGRHARHASGNRAGAGLAGSDTDSRGRRPADGAALPQGHRASAGYFAPGRGIPRGRDLARLLRQPGNGPCCD